MTGENPRDNPTPTQTDAKDWPAKAKIADPEVEAGMPPVIAEAPQETTP